jgi:hypothetical protein
MLSQTEMTLLKQELSKYPDLCIEGFRYNPRDPIDWCTDPEFSTSRAELLTPWRIEGIEITCAYLQCNSIDKKQGSYGLKHEIERWNNHQLGIPNGCAILGAILSGYKIDPIKNNPNCKFKM